MFAQKKIKDKWKKNNLNCIWKLKNSYTLSINERVHSMNMPCMIPERLMKRIFDCQLKPLQDKYSLVLEVKKNLAKISISENKILEKDKGIQQF